MNAPFNLDHDVAALTVREARLDNSAERSAIDAFVLKQGGKLFQGPNWLQAVAQGTGNQATGLTALQGEEIVGWFPLNIIHSPVFGRMLASSGFAVEGGILAASDFIAEQLASAAEELALRLSCNTIEARGGFVPKSWDSRSDTHCGFISDLSDDDEAQLLAIPRKQRAEVRKGLKNELRISVGRDETDRAAHYAVYAESVRNLGTPVFPRSLFDAVMDSLDADILTVRKDDQPVASVLSLYHNDTVMPYWGGGTFVARHLRANEVMYYELMLHARKRGCTRFDFGRSKTNSGPYNFKKNWGFEPQPLEYVSWHAPGTEKRDADPTSAKHAKRIELWRKLPLSIANRIGPFIARGLG